MWHQHALNPECLPLLPTLSFPTVSPIPPCPCCGSQGSAWHDCQATFHAKERAAELAAIALLEARGYTVTKNP